MSQDQHLNDEQLAAVIAGLSVDPAAQAHLAECLACRRSVQMTEEAVALRRRQMEAQAPDLTRQRREIMDAIGRVDGQGNGRRSRQLLLAAAAAVAAVLLGSLLWTLGWQRPEAQSFAIAAPTTDIAAEEVLAQVDAVLASDQIPGFAPLEGIVPDDQELERLLEEES
jgi:hypothetical protein